jgi:hypothetical protein
LNCIYGGFYFLGYRQFVLFILVLDSSVRVFPVGIWQLCTRSLVPQVDSLQAPIRLSPPLFFDSGSPPRGWFFARKSRTIRVAPEIKSVIMTSRHMAQCLYWVGLAWTARLYEKRVFKGLICDVGVSGGSWRWSIEWICFCVMVDFPVPTEFL